MVWPVGFEPTKAVSKTAPQHQLFLTEEAAGLPIPLTTTLLLYNRKQRNATDCGLNIL